MAKNTWHTEYQWERENTVDFTFAYHGSIVLLIAQSDLGKEWAAEYLPSDTQRFGQAYAIETNHFAPILRDLAESFVVKEQ